MHFSKKSLGTVLFCVVLVSLIFQGRYYADYQTTLSPGIYIMDGTSDLRTPYWSVPFVYDWNGDGKKDLLVGHNHHGQNGANYGYVSYFRNIGTDAIPAFHGSSYIQSCSFLCSPLNALAEG